MTRKGLIRHKTNQPTFHSYLRYINTIKNVEELYCELKIQVNWPRNYHDNLIWCHLCAIWIDGSYLPGLGVTLLTWTRSIETNGRFEAERPPTSVGPPSDGRAAFLSPVHSLYSTRPHGLVQAIFWHTCPDQDLGL